MDNKHEYLDRRALEYCNLNVNLYFACLWPAADDERLREQALHILGEECGQIIHERDVNLGYNGLFNFMVQIYEHQGWTGTYENRHMGVRVKVDKCHLEGKPTHAVIFECCSLERVAMAKEKIRKLFSMGNDAIHISDNDKETRLMAELLLNPNSRHHLRYGNPDSCTNFNQLFNEYRDRLKNYEHQDAYIIDSSSVLAVYGLRDCRDLDFLTTDPEWEQVLRECREIDNHASQLRYYQISLNDMLNNPQNYFVYRGVKFVSLNALKAMKQCRGEEKDKYDVKIIERFEKKGKVFAKPVPRKRERKKIRGRDILLWLKYKRKEIIEKILKYNVPGKILLKLMKPVARITHKEDKWSNYFAFWEKQR